MGRTTSPPLKTLRIEREALRKEALEQGYSEAEWAKIEAETDLEIDRELLEEAKDAVRRDPDALYSRKVQSAIYYYSRTAARSDPDTQAAFKALRKPRPNRFDPSRKTRMSKFEVRNEIRNALEGCLLEISRGEPDRWPAILDWLREGRSVNEIFPAGFCDHGPEDEA